MSRSGTGQPEPLQRIRAELVACLRRRFDELEEAVFARIYALAEPGERPDDPQYVAGLHAVVAEVIEYGLTSIEQGEDFAEPIPPVAATQARLAARIGVRLDTVLRRYAAGDRLIAEFIMDEADRFPSRALRHVLSSQGPHVDRLMASVSSEYMQELERMRRSPAQRLAERVQRLLAGESPLDVGDLGYELDGWHLGAIVTGAGAEGAISAFGKALGGQVLVVPRGEGMAWAWIGSHRPVRIADVQRLLPGLSDEVSLSIGEARHGLHGWRLTHREAQAAFEVMLRRPAQLIRCGEVVLLAAVLRDETLARSLTETYLKPLDDHGDSGSALRQTLRAYLDSGLNAATAAAALKVDRHTVQRRLRKVEDALGRLLPDCHAELEVALSLDELDQPGEIEEESRTTLVRPEPGPGGTYKRRSA